MYVPDTVVDNHDLARIMETSDEWIRERTGIIERRFVDAGVPTSEIGAKAAQAALEDAGVAPSEVDYVIFATMTPDMYFPGSAPFLQRQMGLERVPCLDIRQQCAGFIYGLQLGDALIRSGVHRRILLVGAEVHSCFMPWRSWDVLLGKSDAPVPEEEWQRNTATRDRTVLFGDGAGAVLLSAEEDGDRGVIDILLRTDGNHAERLCTWSGGSRWRPYVDEEMIATGAVTPMVEGREVYRLAVRHMPEVTVEILDRHGLEVGDIDLLIMHQANLRINEGVQKRLRLPDERVFNNIQRYGNTTAGTIPIALYEARQQERLHTGDLVCLVGLGSGLNWGSVLYRY